MQQQSVLFIAPTRIGDAVLASALLAHIATTQPQARVTIATSPLSAPLYEGYPLLERIIPMQKQSYSRHWLKLLREVVGTRWHSVWDIRNSAPSFLLRATHRHRFPGSDAPMPKVEQYAQLLKTGPLPYPVLWTKEEHRAQAAQYVPEGQRYLVLAPIANWAPKEWPLAHFITLAQHLFADGGACHGWRPVVVCAAHERARAMPLLEALAPYQPVDLTEGLLPLLSVYACMQRAHGFIGNDSGLMHMAAAAGIPTLGLFGPTPSVIYGPYGRHTQALRAPNDALEQLTPQQVAETFSTLLAR